MLLSKLNISANTCRKFKISALQMTVFLRFMPRYSAFSPLIGGATEIYKGDFAVFLPL
jgi:hypothetical protein